MTILFLSSRIPYPPDRGDKVRTLFLLRHFASLGEVHLLSLVDEKTDSSAMQLMSQEFPNSTFIVHSKLRRLLNLFSGVFSRLPFQVVFYRNPKYSNALAKICSAHKFDLVYTHLIRMTPYAKQTNSSKVILDYTDCISLEYKRSLGHRNPFLNLFFAIEAHRTARYELALKDSFKENWVISSVDLQAMQMECHPRCVLIPNMVNVPAEAAPHSFANRLIFSGYMSVPHNVSAAVTIAEKIMPRLVKKYPHLRLFIVGAHPNARVKALDGKNNTLVRGFVPDLYAELQASDIFLAPLYFSAGVQNKVLEAMACGIPVITTANVANGLQCTPDKEVLLAQNEHEFVSQCIRLIESAELRNSIGSAGQEFVKHHFSRQAVTDLINARIDQIIYS